MRNDALYQMNIWEFKHFSELRLFFSAANEFTTAGYILQVTWV